MNFKQKFCITVLIIAFICFLSVTIFRQNSGGSVVKEVISPLEFKLSNNDFKLSGYETFDGDYTQKNSILASKLGITENEAFIMGNLGKYWAKNILFNRKIKITKNDIIYYKFSYARRFENSAFCIKDGKPLNQVGFSKLLKSVRSGKFVILDLDSDECYPVSKENRIRLKNFVVVRKSHVRFAYLKQKGIKNVKIAKTIKRCETKLDLGSIKIILSDSSSKFIPDRNCSNDICKEILSNVNKASKTIDMAIYGYSSTPAIEKALKSAQERGVKIRAVYDRDKKGGNIYPDTDIFVKLVTNSVSDAFSDEVGNTMHNKFYVFDGNIVITGSANLSHTDMSGFNTNAIIVIRSKEAAKIYTDEFNQMYGGKFHNSKQSTPNKKFDNCAIYFSPQDKAISNAVLPIIKQAKKYIYIPAFVITEKRVTKELINAKNRGVDVKIILDALNAVNIHSKTKELRAAGVPVKAENWAGKMHSKSIIADDEYLIIGSMNFSNSGENKNDENLVLLKNSVAAKFYKEFFLYQWNKIPEKWLKYTPRAEGRDSIGSCTDGLDNNYDGLTDAQDIGCSKQKIK